MNGLDRCAPCNTYDLGCAGSIYCTWWKFRLVHLKFELFRKSEADMDKPLLWTLEPDPRASILKSFGFLLALASCVAEEAWYLPLNRRRGGGKDGGGIGACPSGGNKRRRRSWRTTSSKEELNLKETLWRAEMRIHHPPWFLFFDQSQASSCWGGRRDFEY